MPIHDYICKYLRNTRYPLETEYTLKYIIFKPISRTNHKMMSISAINSQALSETYLKRILYNII